MQQKLKDCSKYISVKILSNTLTIDNYISTENMLPDKKGIKKSESLPNTKVTEFKEGDILLSNIRPYFKKIWYATFDGGCSGDVLVIRANIDVDSKYLFYLLSTDEFFDYNVKGSKGTKMPRGDKQHIMNYEFELPSLSEQKRIADILTSLDDKIELNNQMNQTLEEMAKVLYKQWFVDFEFPNEDGKPYKSSGGEMIESELGLIPKGWSIETLGNTSNNFDAKRKPLSKREREQRIGRYPYYGATSIIDYVDDYIFDGKFLLIGEDGTVMSRNETAILQLIEGKSWVNNHAHIIQGEKVSTEFIYCHLLQYNISHLVTGAVQLKITQQNLNSIQFILENKNMQSKFENIIKQLFSYKQLIYKNNEMLSNTKTQISNKYF